MNTNEIKKLYTALRGKGYSTHDLGDEKTFETRMGDKNNRKELYDWVSSRGDFRMGNYNKYEERLTSPMQPEGTTTDPIRGISMAPEEQAEVVAQPQQQAPIVVPKAQKTNSLPQQEYINEDELQKNREAFKDEFNPEYVEGFGQGFKQGWKGMKEGVRYLAGETANLITGTSRDDKAALDELNERVKHGEQVSEERAPWLSRIFDKWVSSHPALPPKWRNAAESRKEQDKVNKLINQALEDAGGDIDQARRILARQWILGETWGDRIMEDASKGMSELKPTRGFGAWVGNLVPQMIPSAAAVAASVVTKNPKFASLIGKVGMGAMTAATAGQSMKEARDAGASDSEVWTVGIVDGAIEYATEKLPFDRYTTRLFNGTKKKVGQELAEAVVDNNSPARNELERLLTEANKKLGGRLLNGKNVKDYAADILAEGASEFTAEALQTITPMIYENPEDYPTINEILQNGWEGAKAGLFMGAVLGGASKSIEHQQQRSRRKGQGFVDIAQVKGNDGLSDVAEIVGRNEENGNLIILQDGETSEVAPSQIEQNYRFSFEEFERGVLQSQSDDAYDNGYSLETSQELNDAKNMLDVQAENIRRTFALDEDVDIDEFLGDDPIEGIMLSRRAGASEEEQQAKLDYINAKATYDGMLQRMRDDIDSQVEANNQRIDQVVNRDTKMIVPAKMKLDDRPVYIVGGNVVLHDDGSVNNSESTQDIIIYDEAKGGYEFTSPSAILEVGQSLSADELKATQASQIAEQYATTKGDQIDGVLPFAQGDTYNILGEDGVQHTAQIIADNGDGSVQVVMDGATEAVVMPKQQVQAMSQAYNKARAVAYNEQKKAKEVAQPRKLTLEEVDTIISAMESNAVPAPEIELTPENWVAEFGENGIVATPIGDVKMGENQYLKLLQRKRSKYFGMIRPTLESPDIVLEEYDPADGAERDTKMLFVKTFVKSDGSRYIHFESVTVRKEDKEVSISSHEVNAEDLKKKMHNDNVVHLNDLFSDSEMRLTRPQSEGSDLVPTPNSSDSKGTTSTPQNQDVEQKNVVAPAQPESQPQIPTLKNGEPDYNAMDADMFTEQYVSQFGEGITETVARNNIKEADKKIASIKKQIEGITDPNKLPALYTQLKEAEGAKAKYTAVIENLGLSEDADESNASRVQRMKQDATPRIAQLFPDGLPNVEAVILADIATGNKIRWSDKVVNGAVVSKGLGSELGLAGSNAERTRRIALIGKDAPTPEEYAEQLRERLDAMGIRYEESELRDKVFDVYSSADTRGKAWEQLEEMSANMQAEPDVLDYEEEQMRRAYERSRNEQPQDVDFEQAEPEIPSQEEYNQIAQEFDASTGISENEFDEDGLPFVISSAGTTVFGEIKEETGLTPAPIKLSIGNSKYGLVHLEKRHGKQIRNAGFNSVEQFVEYVCKNYKRIRQGENSAGEENGTYLLQIEDNHNNTLYVELSADGSYWGVNSGGVFRKEYGSNKKEVWSASEVQNEQSATDSTLRDEDKSDNPTTPNGDVPSTSDNKDTTSEPKNQEVAEKKPKAEEKPAMGGYGKYQQFHDEYIKGLNERKFIPNIDQIKTNIRQLKKKIKSLENGMAMGVSSDEEFAMVQAAVNDATDQLNAYNDILATINKQMREAEKAEQAPTQSKVQQEIQHLEEIKDYPGADKKAVQKEIDRLKASTTEEPKTNVSEAFSIEPAQYTNKRGKVLDMHLVKFSDLTKEQQRAAKELAKSERGWYDSKQGGFMMRSEESAKKLAETILGDEAAVSEAQPVSLADVQSVSNGDVVFTEPQQSKQSDGKNAPVWQYSISVDEDGYTTLRREDVSGVIPIGDARFTQHADSPEEMLDILRNPLNGMQEILDAVGTTLENKIATRELNRKIETERRRKYEELRQNGVNGFKIGDKVLYTPEGQSRKPIEATIHDFEEFGDNKPVLDVGLAPVMYELAEWDTIKKPQQNQSASSQNGQDLTTGSSIDNGAVTDTKVVISNEGAKHELNKLIHKYVGVRQTRGFISDLAKALGDRNEKPKQTYYFEFKDKARNTYTLRISNHNVNGENIGENEKEISIVIKSRRQPNNFITGNADVKEYVYFKESIANGDGHTLAWIAQDIATLLDTGIYADNSGSAVVNKGVKDGSVKPQQESQPTAETANPSGNRLVTDERYAELRARMRKKLGGQMNIGIDPEILAIGTEMAVYHLEKGARKFTEYAKAMIADLGDVIRPYLKAFYNGARNLPEVESNEIAADMTPYDEVQLFDVANFDKSSVDAIATAETVVRETEVQQEVEIAQERIKKTRAPRSKKEKKSVTSQEPSLFGEPQNDKKNGTDENSAADNRGTELGSEELSEAQSVGTRTPVQDTSGDRQSKRMRLGDGSRESRSGSQYDVTKNYSNEEIGEIVSSVTDIVNGKVVITGAVTDDIKAICRQYESGGVAKKGRGILDEYYTDGKIVDAVNMLIAPYFEKASAIRVLEPSVGVGNFIEATRGMRTSDVVAFEINDTTARIAKILYPNVDVNLRSFETEFIDDSGNKKPMPQKFNLVMGNPPYGSHRGLYKGLGEESKIARYEDYFVKRSLDVLEDGGVLAMVLPSSWIDRHTKYGGYTIKAAYRLPSGAFEATQVGTDIVVLKKDSSILTSEHVPYFEQHPDKILGEVKQRKGRYGKLEDYVEGDIDVAIEAIERDHAKQLAERLNVEDTNDNLNDIQTAIEETGSVDKAEAIVKRAKAENQTAEAEQTPGKEGEKQSKYKVELNRSAETAPTSDQFTHEFSEGEIEAFEDTDYDGTIHNPNKHRKYANYVGGNFVHDFYYAEGDIYIKLSQLEADKNTIIEQYGVEQYEKQKRLLEKVLPKRKGLNEITISPNTAFVKNLTITSESGKESLKNLFEAFCRKLPYRAFGDSTSWEVIGYVNNEQVYGQDKQRNQLIRERRKRVANELFVKFLNEELSEDGKRQVVMAFNREYNSVYRPDYSKVPMFSTINKDFKGKPLKLTSVQLAGIGRMTVKGVGVLAHEVGFGKTLSGILAMHEAMTRGFATKPLIVVPNDNILKQWVETMNEVLPEATVNTLGNLGANYNLDGFKVNDGEFTIVTYEGLKAMSFSDDTYNRLADRFSYITDDLNKHQSERDIQKEIEKKNELKGKLKRGAKASYNFEDFGFDWLTVDEVHNANHIVSKVRLDKSIASDFRSQSQRTSDLGLKTWLAAQYIQEENNGRNVLLLSATPFTNKPLEYYSILSLVANDMLRRKGFFNVDQFFATFMEADNELEIAANGRPVQKTNVRRFRNNGLFQQLLSEFIDIKGEEDNPDLVRPTRQNKEYKIAQNELTAEAMAEVQDLLSDNEKVLQGIGHARAAAFSPYATSLIGRRPKNHKEFVKNSPKIDATIKLIEQNKKDRPDAGQIIYSEVGVEFFPMIRDYLVHESGFKSNEVRIITGATSNNERVNIQTAFNKGEVKVVIGSPAIKEGLNLQENTTDMYILSLPWNFTQLRQIEGRGWRQGNKWENIRINYMLTNDSVDVFMLQRLQLKQGLYNEAMKSGAESLDVSDIDTAELKTQLITDPAVRAEIVTVQEREKLQQEKTQIEADLSFVTRKFEGYNKLIDALNSRKQNLEQFKSYAARNPQNEYWNKRAEEEAKKILQTESEIELEKERLRTRGVNIDDIERQVEQSQAAIEDIQKRIEGLDDFQQELTGKFIREDRAKAAEQGHNLSAYIKERKKENQSGFYKIRPKDEDVRFRDGDTSFAHTYDDAFAELEMEYQALDKNNEVALKAFRSKKRELVQEYVNYMSDNLAMPTTPIVFDPSDVESVKKAYEMTPAEFREEFTFEAFMERVSTSLGTYVKTSTITLYNVAKEDDRNTPRGWLAVMIHENSHKVVEDLGISDRDKEILWDLCKETAPKISKNVEADYESNAERGEEYLVYTLQTRAEYERLGDLLVECIVGEKNVQDVILSFKDLLLLRDEIAERILNTFRDGYRKANRGENYSAGRGQRRTQGKTENGGLADRFGRGYGQNYGSRVGRDLTALRESANELASQLNTPIRIVEDVNTITDNNTKLQERKRNAKGWFDNKANEVVVVLPNATSVEDVRETIFHEVVGHKGMQALVGKERFNAFLDKVYANASEEMRRRIALRAAKLGWDFHEATEEYIAEQAEQGFEERENRNFFEVVRDLFLDMLSKAKIALGYRINDNDLRYMLWRTYQMQRSKGAMAVAEDIAMQHKLGVGNFRARQISEEEQIIAKAKKDGTYLKTPNGKPTNLTPKQWTQVRTKAFKRWFGDWEKAARIEKLRTSESVSIVGNEIESSDDMKQYRKNALEYGKSLRGEYRNADTGRTIIINRDSLTEVLHHDGNNVAHIQSIAAIPQMVERGIFITSEPVSADASDKLKNAKEVQYYVCGLNIGGVPYTVKFVVAEYENGERYYDHSLTQIEKGDLLNRAELSSTVADSKSPISGIKDKRLVSILQTNSSKIVDANGEPLVVEHSTWNEDFHTFDISKLGESSGDNGIYGSGFYFGNVGETEMYGDRVIRSYLNVKNPFALPEDNMMQFFDYLVENFDKEGLRDVVVTNSGKSSSIGAIIDAIKEVKANHSRGEYNELIKAMGQYWTPSSAEDRVIEQTIFRKVGFAFYRSLTPFIEHNIGQIEFSKALRNAGYDGVIYDNHEYVAFYPNQIKLADGSNTTFDSDNDDIRFRDGGSTVSSEGIATGVRAEYEKLTKKSGYQARETLQDKMLSLRRFMEMTAKAYGIPMEKIKDWENAYQSENALSSKNEAQVEEFDRLYGAPLIQTVQELRKKGYTYEQIDDYLQIKHGIERNREMAVRAAISDEEGKMNKEKLEKWNAAKERVSNDQTLDSWEKEQRELDRIAKDEFGAEFGRDYSGLTAMYPDTKGNAEDAMEKGYAEVNTFENNAGQSLINELWKRIRAANMQTLNKTLSTGLISKETFDSISSMYSYYVPLRGFAETTSDEVYGYLNNEPMAFNAPIRKARGRGSKADQVLPNILSAAHSAILQGNRNAMKNHFLNFVQHYPTDLVSVANMWVEYDKLKKEWVAKFPDINDADTAEEVEAKTQAFEERMQALKEKYPKQYKRVTSDIDVPYIVPKHLLKQHQILVKRNGVDVVLTVNGSPRLAIVMNGTQPTTTLLGKAKDGASAVTRYLSSMYTSLNPEFVASNYIRDAVFTNLTVWVRESLAYAARFNKNKSLVCNPVNMGRLILKYSTGTLDMNNEVEKAFYNFVMNGGETGYAKLASIEQLKKDIGHMIDPTMLDNVKALSKKLTFLNRSAESSARFAAFLTSRQMGRSVARSVADAKEISVNFNRKGAGDLFMDAKDQIWIGKVAATGMGWAMPMYAFFNAGIQGLTLFLRIHKRAPLKATALTTGIFLLGALIPTLLEGDDEEEYYELPESVRRQNIVFRVGNNTWAKIPLPIEMRAIYGLGEMSTSIAKGKEDLSNHGIAYKMAEQLTQALPINVLEGEGGLGTLVPTLAVPIVEALSNEDWMGYPIYREDIYKGDKDIPEYQRVYARTGKGYVAVSKFLNDITGGDNRKRGAIQVNPAVIEHLVDGYLGGPAQFMNKVISSAEMAFGDKEFDMRSVPFVNRVLMSSNATTSKKTINNYYCRPEPEVIFVIS